MKLSNLQKLLKKKDIGYYFEQNGDWTKVIRFEYKNFGCRVSSQPENQKREQTCITFAFCWPNASANDPIWNYVDNPAQLFKRIDAHAEQYKKQQSGLFDCDCNGEVEYLDTDLVRHKCKTLFSRKTFGDEFIEYKRFVNKTGKFFWRVNWNEDKANVLI